jgi:hypothetical protein
MAGVDYVQQGIAGLCADCLNARGMTSQRGSTFILCQLSFVDSAFDKYPRLPVTSCRGYEQAEQSKGPK